MIAVLRSLAFQAAYWITSVFYVLGALPLLLVPSRKPMMLWILGYTRTMCFWMRWIAGVRIRVAGGPERDAVARMVEMLGGLAPFLECDHPRRPNARQPISLR